MEALIVLILFGGLAVFVVPLIMVISHGSKLRALQATVNKLAARLANLESGAVQRPAVPAAQASASPATSPVVRPLLPVTPAPAAWPPVSTSPEVAAILKTTPPEPAAAATVEPPPSAEPAPSSTPPPKPKAAIDWEAFFGVKLFAWLGGFVLFLGVVFLVKYSFENNLITPAMRVVIGAVIGLGLLAAGWLTGRRSYRVPGQSLCATGVLVLYADIFGAHEFYGLISLMLAFVLMSAVTVAAFLLAVQMNAQVIVVLGLVGGFLTPPLLTSGNQSPLLLFGYVALLKCRHCRSRDPEEMGLPAVTRRDRDGNHRVALVAHPPPARLLRVLRFPVPGSAISCDRIHQAENFTAGEMVHARGTRRWLQRAGIRGLSAFIR